MDCPNCRSQNTTTFPMAYDAGTSYGNFRGSGTSYGGAGLNSISVSGGTFAQTNLAARCAPPELPSATPYIVLSVVVCHLLTSILFAALAPVARMLLYVIPFPAILFVMAVFVVGGQFAFWHLLVKPYLYVPRVRKLDPLFHEWERSWICTRCGYAWMI